MCFSNASISDEQKTPGDGGKVPNKSLGRLVREQSISVTRRPKTFESTVSVSRRDSSSLHKAGQRVIHLASARSGTLSCNNLHTCTKANGADLFLRLSFSGILPILIKHSLYSNSVSICSIVISFSMFDRAWQEL